MRKSGWAAAAGLGSLVLLLTACGGSSGSSSTSTPTATTTANNAAGQPSTGPIPAKGSTVLIVQKSAIGYVLALAKGGQVVYTYAKDTKGGASACTGSCASIWPPVTGIPVASAGSTGLGTLGTVTDANGAKQATYNGMPLYTFKGAKALATKGEGVGGVWHVIKLSQSNVAGA
jgi:predicted lipoprotein with Yx(FWY)xxD motif